MKRTLFLSVAVMLVTHGLFAQATETFDIATFQPPAGWQRQQKSGPLLFSTVDKQKGTFAVITFYGSGESAGDAKRDFDAEWQRFIAEQLEVKNQPELEPARTVAGWTMISGGATFESELGTSVVILNTFSGFGKTFSVAAVFNDQGSVPAIEACILSIKLKKPEAQSSAPAVASDSNAAIIGTWSASASGQQRYDDYKNPYAVNNYGYSKAQYTFNADGSYTFLSKTFRMTFDKILLVRERGTFQISGNQITIAPQTSVIEAWSKRDGTDKWGKLLTSQKRSLERVTYTFTKHYFSGIQLWNLVLQAQAPTERDGPFSSNTTFPNAWYYAPISPNNIAIDLP